MAMAKCESCGPAVGLKKRYVRQVKPLEFSNPAVICNASGCFKPAFLWLDETEARAYDTGERYFLPITGALKIAVT